jgi:hypothetical protein
MRFQMRSRASRILDAWRSLEVQRLKEIRQESNGGRGTPSGCFASSKDAALKGTATKTGKAILALARLLNLRLPVSASAATTTTAAAASVAASATAAVTTTSTAAPTTAAATPAACSTTTAAFALRAGFVHYYLAAFEIFSVECGYGFIGFPVVADFYESESARLSRKTIADQCN